MATTSLDEGTSKKVIRRVYTLFLSLTPHLSSISIPQVSICSLAINFLTLFSHFVVLQVEFYFNDSNLPSDNFLRETISESEDEVSFFFVV